MAIKRIWLLWLEERESPLEPRFGRALAFSKASRTTKVRTLPSSIECVVRCSELRRGEEHGKSSLGISVATLSASASSLKQLNIRAPSKRRVDHRQDPEKPKFGKTS